MSATSGIDTERSADESNARGNRSDENDVDEVSLVVRTGGCRQIRKTTPQISMIRVLRFNPPQKDEVQTAGQGDEGVRSHRRRRKNRLGLNAEQQAMTTTTITAVFRLRKVTRRRTNETTMWTTRTRIPKFSGILRPIVIRTTLGRIRQNGCERSKSEGTSEGGSEKALGKETLSKAFGG